MISFIINLDGNSNSLNNLIGVLYITILYEWLMETLMCLFDFTCQHAILSIPN